jgi:hypothetical protein
MKLGFLAASAMLGVISLAPASWAQDGSDNSQVMSRSARTSGVATESAARVAVPTKAPTLENARPAAGMLPEQPSGPVREATTSAFNTPGEGGDLRRSLR